MILPLYHFVCYAYPFWENRFDVCMCVNWIIFLNSVFANGQLNQYNNNLINHLILANCILYWDEVLSIQVIF